MRLSLMLIVLLTAASLSVALAHQAQATALFAAPQSTEAEPFETQSPEPEPSSSLPATGAIYRWVDAQGRVHYSDRPLANAQAVAVNPVVTEFARIPVAAGSQAVVSDNDDTAAASAERTATLIQAPAVRVSFIEPTDEQSIRANDGNLRVRWQAQAERLNSGLLFLLRHNDRVVYQGEAPVYNFENLDRGAHELQVQAVVNDNGRAGDLLAESELITVYILRASILNPNSP